MTDKDLLTQAKERVEGLLTHARQIAEKAKSEKRDFTPDEKRIVDNALAESKSYRETAADAQRARNVFAQLDEMAGHANTGGGEQFLSFSKAWADGAADKVMPVGQKALATGSSVFVDVELTTTPIPIERPATSLLDLIPVQQHGQPSYSYIRQSVRTNNAAVVAEGAVKPTSVYTIVKIDNSLSVVAHLSEAVPRYWFEDAAALRPFMQEELAYGLRRAVEAKVLADINATSGIQTQAFSTSVLETLRKSVTKLEVLGYNAAWFLLNPADWEAIELGLLTQESFDFRSLPFDPVTRRLWGIPVSVSTAQAAGVSHTVATGVTGVDTDTTGVAIQWSETSNADDWSRNLVRARCEGRFGTSVYQPLGVVVGDLTA